jgi:transposase InsO family protein
VHEIRRHRRRGRGAGRDVPTLGSHNGSAFTARRFRTKLAELGIRHRRGGLPRPGVAGLHRELVRETERTEVWLNEDETLGEARRGIGGYLDRYHHRPHSRLDYKTPYEVKQTWKHLQNIAA